MAKQRSQIIGSSPALLAAIERADRVAPRSRTVLIYGESGTGKELFARRIHEKSSRAAGPFVAVNCAAIAKDLFESDMFGHERGAFTGAHQAKAGFFEQAHGGTLFLDEIGDMSIEHQTKVLRALQEGEVRRVGASRDRQVDVRVVAATHRDLSEWVAQGLFREDLLYRLAKYQLRLPALRDRGQDVLAIAKALLAREGVGVVMEFSQGAEEFLLRHTWPGNIRGLEDAVGAAAIDARGGQITEKELEANLVLGGLIGPTGLRKEDGGGEGAIAKAPADSVVQVKPAAPAAVERKVGAGVESGPPKPSEVGEAGDARLSTILAFIEAHGQIAAADVRRLFHLEESTGLEVLCVASGTGAAGAAERVSPPADTRVSRASREQRLKLALEMVAKNGRVTRAEYARAAKVSQRTAKRDLVEFVRAGELRAEGQGRPRMYVRDNVSARR